MQKLISVILSLTCALAVPVSLAGQDTLMVLLDKELLKMQEEYRKKEQPAYFIDMRVHDLKSSILQYSSGILTSRNQSRNRIITTGMRIGNYAEDNTSTTEDERVMDNFNPAYTGTLPIEDDSLAICFSIDRNYEITYEKTLQQYKTYLKKDKPAEKKENIPAFSTEKSSVYYEKPTAFQMTEKEFFKWKDILKNISETISNDTDIVTCEVALLVLEERIYYLNSEGTRIVQNRPQCQLQIIAAIKTGEGNMAPMTQSYIGRNLAFLPTPEKLGEDVLHLRQVLGNLKKAPIADPYAGPAILSPEAAGVFFHEIFGHRIEGQRLNNTFDSRTFKDEVGKVVINQNITIVSDPTRSAFNDTPLFGSYAYDDEGIPARPVTIVDKGVLKEFLMSRIPTEGQLHSNGHGRCQVGSAPYSRQSNLIITSVNTVTEASMRKMLEKECKKQGKQYGYYIMEVFGGFTSTDLFSPQVFNILPTLVYRVYVDGRPDELVRSVSFIGTPLTVFSEIIASGDKCEVFNGFCGAESGNIPVSTVSPGLLIKKIETQKMPETRVVIPLLPSPVNVK
jgi:TldD protein